MTSLCLLLVGVSTLLVSGDILEYYVLEEQPPWRTIGDLLADFQFDDRLTGPMLASLRFTVLTQPAPEARFFAVNESTGIVQTTSRIDREAICPGLDDCVVKFDVAVRSVRAYFQMIKACPLRI